MFLTPRRAMPMLSLLSFLLVATTSQTTSAFCGSCNIQVHPTTTTRPANLQHAAIRSRNSRASFSFISYLNSVDHNHEPAMVVVSNNEEEAQAAPPLSSPLFSVAAAMALVVASCAILQPLPVVAASTTAIAAATASTPSSIPSALWAYGHYASIIAIFGCLSVERTLVKAEMSVQDENMVVKLDVVYGVMAALLIISGLFRATDYGKGGDFYIHEPLFWAKMTFAGIWGGLSIFPSLTFYKRNFARKDGKKVLPLSEKLATRLQQVINAEISAVLTLPLLATLMARGVWYQPDFPWPVGLVVSLAAMGGSFFIYGKQALTWTEEAAD